MSNVDITFCGGVDSVTGANFLVETPQSTFLVDCGMTQGSSEEEASNWDSFPYDPKDIDFLLVTHAHIDHIGRIGKLVREGFEGDIFSTIPTKELASIMLEDAYSVMSYEHEKGGKAPYFNTDDIHKALRMWRGCEYYEEKTHGDLHFTFKNAGHILGSSMIHIRGEHNTLVFTGDVGNRNGVLTPVADTLENATYAVMESVYGDRVHEDADSRREQLKNIIQRTISEEGALMIPAFSLERTQVLLYELNELVESKQIPMIPIFLDSPLAIRVTELYREYGRSYFGSDVQDDIRGGDDIFSFPGLSLTETKDASKAIAEVSGPKIIIAGAGMSHAGRIVFHEARYLEDSRNTLLVVGYQAPGSFGRRLLEGQKHVELLGRKVRVKAHIEKLLTFSSHADREDLLQLVTSGKDTLKDVFLAMGEDSSRSFLSQRIRDYVGVTSHMPSQGEKISIEL